MLAGIEELEQLDLLRLDHDFKLERELPLCSFDVMRFVPLS